MLFWVRYRKGVRYRKALMKNLFVVNPWLRLIGAVGLLSFIYVGPARAAYVYSQIQCPSRDASFIDGGHLLTTQLNIYQTGGYPPGDQRHIDDEIWLLDRASTRWTEAGIANSFWPVNEPYGSPVAAYAAFTAQGRLTTNFFEGHVLWNTVPNLAQADFYMYRSGSNFVGAYYYQGQYIQSHLFSNANFNNNFHPNEIQAGAEVLNNTAGPDLEAADQAFDTHNDFY